MATIPEGNRNQTEQPYRGLNDFIQTYLRRSTNFQEEMDDVDVANDEDFSESDEEDSIEEDPALLGYQFCAEETIRFLIEEEHFASDDPIIQELEQHLNEHRMKLQQQRHDEKQEGEDEEEKAEKNEQSTSQIDQDQQVQPALEDRKEGQIAGDDKNS